LCSQFCIGGVNPVIGRGFLAEGEPDRNVGLLSHQLWMNRFGGDRKASGKAMTLDDVSYSNVGVMLFSFTFQNADLWVRDEIRLDPHNSYLLPVLRRLKPGISPRQAQAEVVTFAAGLTRDLIACANFANLLLIWGAARQPEIAVRAAWEQAGGD
jgi:hypothetical protein